MAQQLSLVAPGGMQRAPKIKSLHIENFKGFSDFTVDFDDFNILIGKNNSGKSTLLEAVYLAHNFLRETADYRKRVTYTPRSRAFLEFPFFPIPVTKHLWTKGRTYTGATKRNIFVRIDVTYDNEVCFQFQVSFQYGHYGVKVVDPPALTKADIDAFLEHPPAFVPSFAGTVVWEPYIAGKRRAVMMGEGHYSELLRNMLLDVRQGSADKFDRLTSLLRRHFGITGVDAHFNTDRDEFVVAQYEEDGIPFDIRLNGSGFLQMLQILAYSYQGAPATILLDEPDAHLHASLQKQMVGLLRDIARQENVQVIMATHSKEIVNSVPHHLLLNVSRDVRSAVRLSNYQQVLNVLQEIGSLDNVDAATILRDRKCVFVEGDEGILLEALAAKLGIDAFRGEHPARLVPMQGAENLLQIDIGRLFNNIAGLPLKVLAIRDRDYLDDGQVVQLVEEGVRKGIALHVLAKNEIENYLLVSSALYRLVSSEMQRRSSYYPSNEGADDEHRVDEPDVDSIERKLNEICDELRTNVEALVNAAIQKADRGKDPSTAHMEAVAYVRQRWGPLESKLSMCPGKDVLRRFREWCQNEFNVSFGNLALAEALLPNEIDDEIRSILERIVVL